MPIDLKVLLVHFSATWLMTGVIWIVQLVHYPLFKFAEKNTYQHFQREHMRRITWIVMPAMLVELVTGLYLMAWAEMASPLLMLEMVLLFGIWGTTFFIQVPQHQRLAQEYASKIHKNLVNYNWLRTFLWSCRALLLSFIIFELF